MSMADNLLFGEKTNFPRVQRPDKCDKTCIRFSRCSFPKSCPVLEKERRAKKRETERWVMP